MLELMSRFQCLRWTKELVAQRVDGWFGKSKSPSLTLLDVALSDIGLDGSVGGVTSCWLVREVEESLAHASGFLWFATLLN